MSLSGRLDVIFAEQLRNHPEGHALYNKVSADHLKPGTCGFFDEKGDWNVIEQLCDRETWESDGWIGIPEQLRTETDFGIQWPVKLSESAKGYEIDVDVNLKPPISGGINIAFKSSENVGAVLITDPPVERKRLKRDLPALDWVLQNTRKLLDHWPEILSRGLWIVTKTYSVKRCANAVLTAKDDEAKISIQASIPDVANAVPSATWWKQGSHGSWNIYTDDSGIVVFMSGIQCKVGLVRRSKVRKTTRYVQRTFKR
ncbi:hypothetical protein BGW36DRAFT_380944 [Talaromyces proteolyticus]|uniref:Uncharacterized protein n=1 Tax=Talaromyces proteolyticus TaxID=1131652 RepID=A0AAD4PZW7_9EURO|nr:uncharacterized protein BGW36DRAFT_380944 [Talaromyces proteolyticus]KAH8696411.1 hypothetical protein BGW36DRAFT_380944 [Talaromyces proteolyticus]